jgi:excisionase family DNA binding protein
MSDPTYQAERLLTIPEAREILNVSSATASRMIKDGRLPVVRLGGHSVRVAPEVVRKMVADSIEEYNNITTQAQYQATKERVEQEISLRKLEAEAEKMRQRALCADNAFNLYFSAALTGLLASPRYGWPNHSEPEWPCGEDREVLAEEALLIAIAAQEGIEKRGKA